MVLGLFSCTDRIVLKNLIFLTQCDDFPQYNCKRPAVKCRDYLLVGAFLNKCGRTYFQQYKSDNLSLCTVRCLVYT